MIYISYYNNKFCLVLNIYFFKSIYSNYFILINKKYLILYFNRLKVNYFYFIK